MTDGHGDDGRGEGEGPAGPERRELPRELRELEAELRGTRFDPAAELEDEVLARIGRRRSAGRPEARPTVGISGSTRAAATAAAVLALVAALAWLEALGPAGPGEGTRSTAPLAEGSGPADGWSLRWGPDARVLALGTPSSRRWRAGDRELRCGRVDSRVRCRGGELGAASAPGEAAAGAVLRDFCCLDYDGGGPADDGVRVVAGRDEAVVDFWIYEDRDRTRSFSEGDLLRTVVPGVAPRDDAGAAGVRRLDRCCAELDGGERADDGVFVLAGGRERVALAVLYEDENGDGRLGPGDRLRAVRTDDGAGLGDAPSGGRP